MARLDFNIAFKVAKANFFNPTAVINAIPPAKRKALSKIGAFIRTKARSLMRRRKGKSAPGSPPSVHAGHLKKFLYFSYDAINESVVIGPTPFRKGEAPALNEFGGKAVRRKWQWVSRGRTGPTYTAVYPKRPFMAPALESETENPKLMDAWRDAVKPRN